MTITWITALTIVLVIGVNVLIWGSVSLVRVVTRLRPQVAVAPRFRNEDVAIIMAAHNEEAVLADSLRAASALLPPSQIHVVSDGSSDRTAEIAREFGVNVLDLQPNRGKAAALAAGIEEFVLMERFQVVLLLDADTRLSSNYLETGLPLFNDLDVVAVSGVVKTLADPPPRTRTGKFLLAHRVRLYALTQQIVKYGQAAKWANVMPICPGFASMYRTDILSQIDITRPGLVLEDINMTFEIHTKKLGRVAFDPRAAIAYTQDPDNWRDYMNQVYRWTLGYWQTIRVHKRHFGKFWVSVAMQATETVMSVVALICLVPAILLTTYTDMLAHTYGTPVVMGHMVIGTLDLRYILLAIFLPDILLTIYAVISTRRPGLFLLAPLFPFMRFIDSYIVLKSIWGAWHTHSNGQWISPVRRNADSPSTSGRHHSHRTSGRHHSHRTSGRHHLHPTSGRHHLHLVPPLEEERAS
jgi:biofilm PGA synthesis N-glycosyltransferase PgaC